MRVSSACEGRSPLVAPEMTSVPPGRSDLMLCDQVAAPTVSMTASTRCGSRCAGLQRLDGAQLDRPLALGLVATGGEDAKTGGLAEHDRGGRHAAAGALDEDGVAGPYSGVGEEHAVRRQPCGRQTGGLRRRVPWAWQMTFHVGTETCSANVPW